MVESKLDKGASAQILVVEDEAEIRELISLLLLRQGHQVKQCASVPEASECLKKNNYDLVVLDWMLPNKSGLDFLKTELKDMAARPPVLMVTAKVEPQDIVMGLESGADDYITKPFEPTVFTARVKALLRRSQRMTAPGAEKECIVLGDMVVNLRSYELTCKGEKIHLTPSEFKIISYLAEQQGRVLTRDQLINIVQGEGIAVTGRTIDTHVFGLRKKLGESADWIETIRGVGYRIKPQL